MHAIFTQLSGLVGICVFLARAWQLAPVDSAAITGIGAGVAFYVALIVGDMAIRRILAHGPATVPPAPGHDGHTHTRTERPIKSAKAEEMAMAEAAA